MLSQQLALEFQERQSSKEGSLTQCAFRISSEGLPLLLPFITKQIVEASPMDFKHLLQYKTIKFADFVDAEFGEKASQLMLGCCVVVLRKGLFKHHLGCPVEFVCFEKSMGTVDVIPISSLSFELNNAEGSN